MAKTHRKRSRGRPVHTTPHEKINLTLQSSTAALLRQSAARNARTVSAQADLAIRKGLV